MRLVSSVSLLGTSLVVAAFAAACSSASSTGSSTSPTDPADAGVEPPASMKPLKTSVDANIVKTLKNAGLDIATLPDSLDTIAKDEDKLHAVMETFTTALGVECTGCHKGSGRNIDYEAATPKKNVAKKMWANLVRGLKAADGAPIYCDTCHGGKMTFLDRTDPDALGEWMKQNFVEKLVRRDGAEHSCATCHGDPFNGSILESWQK